jgi:hypothetical protein
MLNLNHTKQKKSLVMIDGYYPPVYLLFPGSSVPPHIYLQITHLAPAGYNRHSVYLPVLIPVPADARTVLSKHVKPFSWDSN